MPRPHLLRRSGSLRRFSPFLPVVKMTEFTAVSWWITQKRLQRDGILLKRLIYRKMAGTMKLYILVVKLTAPPISSLVFFRGKGDFFQKKRAVLALHVGGVRFENMPDGILLIRKVCSVNPSVTLANAEFKIMYADGTLIGDSN